MFEAILPAPQAIDANLVTEARAMGEFAFQGERCSQMGWSWDPAPIRLSAQRLTADLTDAQRRTFQDTYQAAYFAARAQAEARTRFTSAEDARRWFVTQTWVCSSMATNRPRHLSRHPDGDRIQEAALQSLLGQFD